MAETVYILCFATSALCAYLLFRGYRAKPTPLLLWSALCFALLAVNNALLVLDLMVFPTVDLSPYRTGSALAAMIVLLVGLVWDSR